MKVISVLMQKGGSGKTTLVESLAIAAKNAGQSVAVIDLDPQATACKWGDRRGGDEPAIISIQPARLPQTLKIAQEKGADLVIIDTPPRAADAAMAAAQAADLILIPSRPTINDLETISTTHELIKGAGARAQVAVVLNDIPAQGQQRQQAEYAIHDMGLWVCPVALGHRTAYTHAAAMGLTAQEYDPRGKAAEEIKLVYKFAHKLLNSPTQQEDNTHGKAKTGSIAGA